MNSRIFHSINDRMNIANAYSNICESTIQSSGQPEKIEEQKPSTDILTYLVTKYPDMSDENLMTVEDVIANFLHADDCEEFTYTLTTTVEFDIENDGIGSYEYWGNPEFDAGHDYPSGKDYDTLGDQHSAPDGTSLITASSEDDINSKLRETADEDGLEWEDEDGRGRYHSFDIPVDFTINVDNPVEFDAWLLKILKDNGVDTSFLTSSDNLKESLEYSDIESSTEPQWQGRGRDVEWKYEDILKDTKAFMDIKKLVGKTKDALYQLTFRAETPSERGEIYSKIQLLLNDIDSITLRHGVNDILPGSRELVRDIEQAEKLGLLD